MIKELLKGDITQKEALIEMNANITYIYMPNCINGFVFNYKGINNIFINKDISYYKKRKAILHELAHIELNQLEQINNDLFAFFINKYEDAANEYINKILNELK